jgi:hypothetical protein
MMTPDPAPVAPLEIRQALLHLIGRSYAIGPDTDGWPLFAYPDGTPVDPEWIGQAWTPEDMTTATHYLPVLFLRLAFEVDAAQAEGRPVDIAGLLDDAEVLVILSNGGEALQARLRELGYLPAGQGTA